MKMRISVTIENEDGSALTEPATRELSIPGVEAFTGPEVFDQVFDQYEREALEARNSVMKEASEKYVSAVGKKKRSWRHSDKQENCLPDQKSIPSKQ